MKLLSEAVKSLRKPVAEGKGIKVFKMNQLFEKQVLRTVYKVVINPNEKFPKPAIIAKRSDQTEWVAVYVDENNLKVTSNRVDDHVLRGFKVVGTWEIPHEQEVGSEV